MKYPEEYVKIFVAHNKGDCCDRNSCGGNDQSPYNIMVAQSNTYSGQDYKQNSAVLLKQFKPDGKIKSKAKECPHIEYHMDKDHANDAESSESVKLPYSGLGGFDEKPPQEFFHKAGGIN